MIPIYFLETAFSFSFKYIRQTKITLNKLEGKKRFLQFLLFTLYILVVFCVGHSFPGWFPLQLGVVIVLNHIYFITAECKCLFWHPWKIVQLGKNNSSTVNFKLSKHIFEEILQGSILICNLYYLLYVIDSQSFFRTSFIEYLFL